MLADYRIRREARLTVSSRLTAVANDTFVTNVTQTQTPSTAKTSTTTTTTTPTQVTEYTIPADVKSATTQTSSTLGEFPRTSTVKRSVETQTPSKSNATVSFNVSSEDRRTVSTSSGVTSTITNAYEAICSGVPRQPVIITPYNDETNSNDSNPIGCYANWGAAHTKIAATAWCCIGDLMTFCDKYEFRALGVHDTKTHQTVVMEVKALLAGVSQAPFDVRRRFPANIRNAENLWVCIDRCPSVEYHLKRILSIFRRPLASLPVDKQRAAIQTFHLAINELRLDISARISEVHLYDRAIFEREFHLTWADTPISSKLPPPPSHPPPPLPAAKSTTTSQQAFSSGRRM